jgi:methyl-accepting chemotaxis protein
MDAVREAVRHGTPAAPQSAEEWAVAAQQILNHTQRVLDESVQQTKDLVAENRKITESARVALETVRADAHTFVEKLSGDTRSTLQAIQDQNKQFIERTAEEALGLLKAALEANRTLFVDEMRPLVKDFRTTLEDFVRHHETYRDSAQLLAASSTSMDESARVLAGSAKSYTEIATSIDDHLRILEGTQEEFVGRVTSSADSMRSASDTMLEVSKALSGDVKTEIEKLARNVVNASADVASINKSLVASSKAMGRVTATLDGKLIPSLDRLVGSIGDAAEKLRTGHGPKRWWQR